MAACTVTLSGEQIRVGFDWYGDKIVFIALKTSSGNVGWEN